MSRYKVMVDDNFHYMDPDYRYQLGVFPSAEEAIAACKKIVDEYFEPNNPNLSATELLERYAMGGEEPFIGPIDPSGEHVKFSAWDYARGRSKIVADRGKS